MPNALLLYPEFPPSYWGGKYALEFIGRKASMPPLGLLTIASMFPDRYELRLVDMNVEHLEDEDLEWADQVFISAMVVQRQSFAEVVQRAKAAGKTVVAGGPYPTSFSDEIPEVDHIVAGEVEEYFTTFLADLEAGRAEHMYRPPSDECGTAIKPPMAQTPLPRFDLVNLEDYGSMAIQFSRGCPFNCEFCDITKLFGRQPRSKSSTQVLAELDELYRLGWRGQIFFVDDNFIGNKRNVTALMPDLIAWQRAHEYPFSFFTEASVNLGGMPDLIAAMADAGFDMIFLGLETPNPEVLKRTNKAQNIKQDDPEFLMGVVRAIQHAGMEVSAGFILGLDGDDEHAFDAQIDFIQRAGIPYAMVGLLTALKGTDLYERYRREGRLREESTGNNVSASLNYVPQIDPDVLLNGYKRVLSTIYDRSLSNYFERCSVLLEHWHQRKHVRRKVRKAEVLAVARSLTRQLCSRQGPAYLRFLARTLRHHPHMLPEAIRLAITGYHFDKVTRQQVLVDEFGRFLAAEREKLQQLFAELGKRKSDYLHAVHECFGDVQRRYEKINVDFRSSAKLMLQAFHESLEQPLKQLLRPQ